MLTKYIKRNVDGQVVYEVKKCLKTPAKRTFVIEPSSNQALRTIVFYMFFIRVIQPVPFGFK